MELDDCWIRLGILAHIKQGQKLSNIFSIQHPSLFTTILRYFSSESRHATMDTIERLVDASLCLCRNDTPEARSLVIQLDSAVAGMYVLQKTYGADEQVVQRLAYFIQKVERVVGNKGLEPLSTRAGSGRATIDTSSPI